MRQSRFRPLFLAKTNFKPFSSYPFYRNETSKSEKTENRLQKQSNVSILNREFSFVECPFDFGFNKFLPNGIRPADNKFRHSLPRRGGEIVVTPIFFSIMRVSGLFKVDFQNRPTVDVQPPKEQKQQKTAFLLLLRKAFFQFFRHRQRNDFRRPVRDVLGFDRERRCFRETGKHYRFTSKNTRSIIKV